MQHLQAQLASALQLAFSPSAGVQPVERELGPFIGVMIEFFRCLACKPHGVNIVHTFALDQEVSRHCESAKHILLLVSGICAPSQATGAEILEKLCMIFMM